MITPMHDFLRVALTGGIAAGKSTVSEHLIDQGFDVIDYDEISREIVRPNSKILQRVANLFGEKALTQDGQLNRQWLADNVFNNKLQLQKLNNIMHPAIYEIAAQRDAELCKAGREIVFHDIPLLAATADIAQRVGLIFNHIITVEAPDGIRIKRMMKTRNMTVAQAQSRINSQSSQIDRERIADVVISSEQSVEDMLCEVDKYVNSWLKAKKAE